VSGFPAARLRRLRRTGGLRSLVRENSLDPSRLVLPLFVCEGTDRREPIDGLPGHERVSVDLLRDEISEAVNLELGGVLLFGVPDDKDKDEAASAAYAVDGIVTRAVQAAKEAAPELPLITDVCLCSYTSHGHCGVIQDGEIANDLSVEMIARVALSHAEAGADLVAPSDMMDGRVAAVRAALDAEGHEKIGIVSYAAKYASAFYGPFRAAASSSPSFGDRRGYQLDPANRREALREIAFDVEEAADIVMVKPALSYLDVIAAARARVDLPLAAYSTSGEYAMVKAAAERGWVDERQAALEQLIGIRRAGADIIVTYWAKDVARWL
jgi:porphobilinogen synthase